MSEHVDVSARRSIAGIIEVPAVCFGTTALANMPGTYGYEVDEARARERSRALVFGER